MARNSCLVILLTLLAGSCQKDDFINDFPAEVSFDITDHLLEGKHITCIEISDEGTVFIGTGNELYSFNGAVSKVYKLEFSITDVAVAPDRSVWIGSAKGGLGHLENGNITWYNSENSGLPRDVVSHVEVAPDGTVWFTSCAFRIGGLGICNDGKFEFLTPENSPLNQNIIADLHIDDEGRVYIATTGTVGRTNIYRITKDSWECLGNEEGTFYWVFSFALGQGETIYVVEDFSLSSAFNTNKLHMYDNNDWNVIELTEGQIIRYFSTIEADRRNYCWLPGYGENAAMLSVFTGKSWISSPAGIFPDDIFTCIKADRNNNIWAGTYHNGVFILNQ